MVSSDRLQLGLIYCHPHPTVLRSYRLAAAALVTSYTQEAGPVHQVIYVVPVDDVPGIQVEGFAVAGIDDLDLNCGKCHSSDSTVGN